MAKIERLEIDIESFSSVDLGKCGVYKYAASPDFEILLFAYSVDGGEVQVVDIASGEDVPDEILAALEDDKITKWSYNVNFERVCLSAFLNYPTGEFLSPSAWRCSMIWAAYLGLPQSLAGAGAVLQVDKKKLEEGKDLIRYFCVPCKGTKANGGRERNMPQDAPDKWELFKKYNKRDVETEMEIQKKLGRFPVPESVWEEFVIDQEINDRGILVDMDMVENAIRIDEKVHEELRDRMKELTELDNPQSVQQLRGWLADNGLEMDSLGKDVVKEAVKTAPEPLREVLTLRQQISKSSVKKYVAMENVAGADNRARGTFRFYGANRSGRFSGRNIQLQNLPQNHLPDLEEARALVKAGDYETLSLLYDDIPDTLSQLIRTAFIPSPGKRYYVADFSSIEARVLSWIAGEQWRIDAFRDGKDIYCMSASSMFGVPVEKHGVNGELRAKGKVAELACGYGGSVGAMKAMGAGKMGLADDEIQEIVTAWRNASPNIVKFWWDIDRAVMQCMKEGGVAHVKCIKIRKESGMLIITLPSGRELFYVKPRIGENKFGSECVTYEGREGAGKWGRVESYGPKFVENIIQGIARDILCYAMRSLRDYDIVAHVHDEIILEAPPQTSLEEICELMGRTPPWAEGLLLRADGFVSDFYKKDD